MPERADEIEPDQPDLGVLLELLHGAQAPFATFQASYRIWRHDERAAAACRADIEEQKRRGAAISTFGLSSGSAEPVEHKKMLRIWRAGDRVREEHEGGPRNGSYGVRAGDLWRFWDPRMGASSNEDEPPSAAALAKNSR